MGGRRWFLLIAARLVQSGRLKTLQVSVSGKWWQQLQAGYLRCALGWRQPRRSCKPKRWLCRSHLKSAPPAHENSPSNCGN
jgi:hypothetical protein